MATWQTRSSCVVYENPWIRVREDAVERPDGSDGIYGVVEMRNPAVFIVPVTDADEIVLVEVERYTTARVSLEIPAGGSDGEDLLVAAQRELREETGLIADSWERIGNLMALNGVCRAPEHIFLARGLRDSGEAHEQAEEGIVGLRRVPWTEALGLIKDGTIVDGETVAALMCAAIELGRVS